MSHIPDFFTNLYVDLKWVELDTDETMVQKYHDMLHLRHDLIHHLINKVLGLKDLFTRHKTLGEMFSFLEDDLSRLSPDVFIFSNSRLLILDVSCSANRENNLQIKLEKYQPVLAALREQSIDCFDFYFFWVSPSWDNLRQALQELYEFCDTESINFNKIDYYVLVEFFIFFENLSEELSVFRKFLPEYTIESGGQIPVAELLDDNFSDNFCSKKFEHWDSINEAINRSTLEDAENIFNELVKDPQVQEVLKDTEHSSHMYQRAFDKLESDETVFPRGHVRPTFFIPYCPASDNILGFLSENPVTDYKGDFVDLRLEQRTCLQMLEFSTRLDCDPNLKVFLCRLLKEFKTCLSNEGDKNLFNTGMITGELDLEEKLSTEYAEFNKNVSTSLSKREFYEKQWGGTLKLSKGTPYMFRNKSIKVQTDICKLPIVVKSGSSFKKHHEVRDYKEKTTIPKNEYMELESFIDLLCTVDETPMSLNPLLNSISGCDSEGSIRLKKRFYKRQSQFLGIIQPTYSHSMSRHSSLIASQLLHLNELRTTDNTFTIMNSGRPNILHIVQGSSKNRGNDVGNAFFTLMITDDKRWASNVFGKVAVTEFIRSGKTYYFCVTPWVRLSGERLNFMKDQYYSTLSTAYDTWSRNSNEVITKELLKHIYVFRVCVSMSPSQRVAELLMDTRYIFMSALSKFSNVEELIIAKFAPPYKNCLEQFIVRQLKKKCIQVFLFLKDNPPIPHKPTFSQTTRRVDSLGGTIRTPSLWSDIILTGMQGIFDDIFVYVHTSKEASSDYHEQVKAMNTILSYQSEYSNMSKEAQAGVLDVKSLKSWLLGGSKVGCCVPVIYHASRLYANSMGNIETSRDLIRSCLSEPLSELESTKACIPEYDRVVTTRERTRREFDRVVKDLGQIHIKMPGPAYTPTAVRTYFRVDVDMSEDVDEARTISSNRVKVHDALLDWIQRYGGSKNFVIDLATWNLRDNNGRVLADTCIKAQYGAKREFYVINLGAKAVARVTENSYKVLAKLCKHEMISIPGDRKLIHIQSMINNTLLASTRRQDMLFYVNGDCTKWSACETMSSFVSMSQGLKGVFGRDITNYNNMAFSSWACKNIQIPNTILRSLKFKTDLTKYINEEAVIHSTQNFLQGMFNYSSSMKAVIATEFAIRMFKKNNPDMYIHVGHLEHSDDYSLCVRSKDQETFEKFRIYHKLSQRLFGINDSVKKTNIQKHILEFISLFSFNGQLYYPNIKKTKEVGTNLSATTFRSDAMSIISRVSEATRLGVPLESSYFMQRVHCCSIADAYSITPGMRNSYGNTECVFSQPLELLGLPDSLPILGMTIKGNPENYRLYNYGGPVLKNRLTGLFVIGQKTLTNLDTFVGDVGQDIADFYSPGFSYPIKNNKLRRMQKFFGVTSTFSTEYFNANLSDTLCKPIETKRFTRWLKAMLFNKSFSQAYMRVSRSALSLRHSLFSSKPCATLLDEDLVVPEGRRSYQTVRNYIVSMANYLDSTQYGLSETQLLIFSKYISCYSGCLETLYKKIDSVEVHFSSTRESPTTVESMPSPFKWINFENKIQDLLQYIINPSNFIDDRKSFISDTSLSRDISKLERNYNIELIRTFPGYARQVFKEVCCQDKCMAVGLVYSGCQGQIDKYITQYLQHALTSGAVYRVIPSRKTRLTSFIKELPVIVRDELTQQDTCTKILHELALVYRLLFLRTSTGLLYDSICKLMKMKLKEVDITVEEFLTTMTLETLDTLNCGEQAKKCLCILKAAFLADFEDARKFVKSRFFYTVDYIRKVELKNKVSEAATIKFLGVTYIAHKIEGSRSVVIEMPRVNRSYWYYGHTIALRAFGLIGQQEMDMKFMNNHDFTLPGNNLDQVEVLEQLRVANSESIYHNKIGKNFLQVDSPVVGGLPFVTQSKIRFSHNGLKKEIGNVLQLDLNNMSITSSQIILFKLPFGNLTHTPMLEVESLTEGELKIDNIDLRYILSQDNLLMHYLKTELVAQFTSVESCDVISSAWKGLKKELRKNFTLKSICTTLNTSIADILPRPIHVSEPPIYRKPPVETQNFIDFEFGDSSSEEGGNPVFDMDGFLLPTGDDELDLPAVQFEEETTDSSFNVDSDTFNMDMIDFNPIDDSLEIEEKVTNMLGQSLMFDPTPQHMANLYRNSVPNLFRTVNIPDSLENTRTDLELGTFDELVSEELFFPAITFDITLEDSSSEGTDSTEEYTSTDIQCIQLISADQIHNQTYGFDKQCRLKMIPFCEYLITCWSESDMTEIATNPEELTALISIATSISKSMGQIKLSPSLKSCLKISLSKLVEVMGRTNNHWKLTRNRSVKVVDQKVHFYALRGFDDINDAVARCSNPNVSLVNRLEGGDNTFTWICQPLKNKDLTNLLSERVTLKRFSGATYFSDTLSTILPKMEMVDSVLICDYDF